MEVRVEKRYSAVYADIKLITESYLAQIQDRGKELLTRLDTVHKIKMTTLAHQKRELASTTVCLAQVCLLNDYLTILALDLSASDYSSE
jgi:hypothetical protein